LRDLFLRRAAEGMRADRKRCIQFTITQNLYLARAPMHHAAFAQGFRTHHIACAEDLERLEIHNRIFFAERVVKTALGYAAMQRHLAALKTRPLRISLAGLLSFVSCTGSFRELRTNAPAHPHLAVAGAARRPQICQSYRHDCLNPSRSLWSPLKKVLPLFHHNYQMAHLIHHTT